MPALLGYLDDTCTCLEQNSNIISYTFATRMLTLYCYTNGYPKYFPPNDKSKVHNKLEIYNLITASVLIFYNLYSTPNKYCQRLCFTRFMCETIKEVFLVKKVIFLYSYENRDYMYYIDKTDFNSVFQIHCANFGKLVALDRGEQRAFIHINLKSQNV